MKTRKRITEPHASVHFENGPNAKNAYETEKNVSPSHIKWAECQKRLKSTEINIKFYSRSTSEGK